MKHKLKAYILDDEVGSINALKWELELFKEELDLVGATSNQEEARGILRKEEIDVLFLDIEMPIMNGFDFIKSLGDVNFEIIFTTAYDEFALKAFDVSAIDYLLKPVDNKSLKKALEKLHKKQQGEDDIMGRLEALFLNLNSTKRKVAIPDVDGLNFIETDSIIRCESDSNYCSLFLENGRKLTVAKTLKEIETLLPETNFIRIHNSHLVNIDFIVQYRKGKNGAIVLQDKTVLPVSRSRKDLFSKGL